MHNHTSIFPIRVNRAPVSLSVVHEGTFTWPSITMQISLDRYRHVKKTLKIPQCVLCLFLHLFMFLMGPMKTVDNTSDTNDTRIIKALFLLELLACLTSVTSKAQENT